MALCVLALRQVGSHSACSDGARVRREVVALACQQRWCLSASQDCPGCLSSAFNGRGVTLHRASPALLIPPGGCTISALGSRGFQVLPPRTCCAEALLRFGDPVRIASVLRPSRPCREHERTPLVSWSGPACPSCLSPSCLCGCLLSSLPAVPSFPSARCSRLSLPAFLSRAPPLPSRSPPALPFLPLCPSCPLPRLLPLSPPCSCPLASSAFRPRPGGPRRRPSSLFRFASLAGRGLACLFGVRFACCPLSLLLLLAA